MPKFAVRSVKVVFNVEESGDDGRLAGVQEIPVNLFEAQFDTTIAALVTQLLVQANGSSEAAAEAVAAEE